VGTAIIALVAFGVVNSASGKEDFGFTVYGSTHTLGIQEASTGFIPDTDFPKGKPVVLNFWGASCPPYRTKMLDFRDTFNKFVEYVIFLRMDLGPRHRTRPQDLRRNYYFRSWASLTRRHTRMEIPLANSELSVCRRRSFTMRAISKWPAKEPPAARG
jgi:hypothetical protein